MSVESLCFLEQRKRTSCCLEAYSMEPHSRKNVKRRGRRKEIVTNPESFYLSKQRKRIGWTPEAYSTGRRSAKRRRKRKVISKSYENLCLSKQKNRIGWSPEAHSAGICSRMSEGLISA
jgi:hypothetical protein